MIRIRLVEYNTLKRDNAALVEALKEIAEIGGIITGEDGQNMQDIAKSALEAVEGDK